MSISVQNNSSALLALQALNRTNDQLDSVQQRISTQLEVGQASDNPSIWATAQGQGQEVNGLNSVTDSLNRASSISDVALSAGSTVLDLLDQLKSQTLSAQDPQQDSTSRADFNTAFTGLLSRISTTLSSASFDGANLLDGSGGDLRFLATSDASQMMTLSAQNLSLGGSIITVASTASINTAASASAVMAQIDASIDNVTSAMSEIGDQAKLISAHTQLVSNLQAVLKTGQGNLIDSDTAADSAMLAALNVKQQLGEQSLSIANSMPQILLSLFK